jgi:hypothetical protein
MSRCPNCRYSNLQLGSEIVVAVVRPTVVDAPALIDGDVRMVEGGELLDVLGHERRVVAFQPRFNRRGVAACGLCGNGV